MSEVEDIAIQNQEAIAEIVWTLNASRGQFSLVFARCNYAQVCDRVIGELQEQFPGILVWDVPVGTDAVLEGLLAAVANSGTVPDAVLVTGLEGVMDLEGVLAKINRGREEWRSACGFPVVLWLTDGGLRSVMRFAPDFESWGTSTRFEMSLIELHSWILKKTEEWFSGSWENSIFHSSDIHILEKEFIISGLNIKQHPELFSKEIQLKWEATLAGLYYLKEELSQSIAIFTNVIYSWDLNERPEQLAIVLEGILKSLYKKVLSSKLPSLKDKKDLVDKTRMYIDFCRENCQQRAVRFVPFFLGDILKEVSFFNTLEELSEQAISITYQSDIFAINSRPHRFLAECFLRHGRWLEAKQSIDRAIQILESELKSQMSSNENFFVNSEIKSEWVQCQLISSRIMIGFNNVPEAIKLLEKIGADLIRNRFFDLYILISHDLLEIYKLEIYEEDSIRTLSNLERLQENLQNIDRVELDLYASVKMLSQLEDCYKMNGDYLKAFETKQARLQLGHKGNLIGFVGSTNLDQDIYVNSIQSLLKASVRSIDLDRLVSRVAGHQHKLTVIYGASGVGKSYLLKGGLMPTLTEKSMGLRDNHPILIRQYKNWKESLLVSLGIVDVETDFISQILCKLDWNEEHNLRTILIFDQF